MKKFYLLVFSIFIITCSVSLNAQRIGFEINLETDLDELPTRFKLNDDGDFVGLVRKALPTDSGYFYNTYLYRISPSGDTMSIKYSKVDTVFNYYRINRLTTEPKGFLLSGWGYKIGLNPSDKFTVLRRIDDNLDLVWEEIFLFDYYYGAARSGAMELINGDIVYACSPHLNSNMFLLRLSSDGDSLNFVSYTGSEAGEVHGLTYNPDSSSIWLHNKWAHYQGSGNSLSSCIELNNKLEQIDVKHYPENLVPPFNSIVYNDSTLLTGGSDWIPVYQGDTEHLIVAYLLDTGFSIKQEVHLTAPDTVSRGAESQSIDYYYPSCIYLGGNHNLQDIIGLEPSWFYITKLNDTLGVEYEKYIGGDDYYWLYSVTAAIDGGVLLAGTRQEPAQSYLQRDGLIIKLDSLGCITGISGNNDTQITDAVVYPNPGIDVINIRTALKGCMFHLFDTWGRQIINRPLLSRITTINTNTLTKGNYYYSVIQNNRIVTSGTWIKK